MKVPSIESYRPFQDARQRSISPRTKSLRVSMNAGCRQETPAHTAMPRCGRFRGRPALADVCAHGRGMRTLARRSSRCISTEPRPGGTRSDANVEAECPTGQDVRANRPKLFRSGQSPCSEARRDARRDGGRRPILRRSRAASCRGRCTSRTAGSAGRCASPRARGRSSPPPARR
jgi:hypothetical protein